MTKNVNKSIVNSIIFILLLIFTLLLLGCNSTNTLEIKEKLPLNLNNPTPLILEDYEWNVYVKENNAQICLTSDGYSSLSKNTQELKRYIIELKEQLKKYKEYYEKDLDNTQK